MPDLAGGTYIDAISDDVYLTRTKAVRERRWRINNNLPGTPAFCPIIRRSQALTQSLQFNPLEALTELDHQFGEDVLMRAAAWLTLKESRASFLIEREADQTDRVKRFAHVMAEHCGKLDEPLGAEELAVLQKGILAPRHCGWVYADRQSSSARPPCARTSFTISARISRHWAACWRGCKRSNSRPAGALARAAAIAFGFVYLHPMSDGNGRIHRFLINDTLFA